MKRIIGITALLLFCISGWKLGASLDGDALGMVLGVVFGSMFGIPLALIAITAKETVRHEHVHRVIAEQPTSAIAQRPQRSIVVDERQRLAASINKRLEMHQ